MSNHYLIILKFHIGEFFKGGNYFHKCYESCSNCRNFTLELLALNKQFVKNFSPYAHLVKFPVLKNLPYNNTLLQMYVCAKCVYCQATHMKLSSNNRLNRL